MEDPLIQLAQKIQTQRKKLKMSIEDVAIATRVSAKYIEAIENSDRSNLPEEVYLIGFLNLILKELKLDKNTLIDEYKNQESYRIIQQILNETPNPSEFKADQVNAHTRKYEPGTNQYFKIYQLYILAFLVIISFSVILINKFNSQNIQANNNEVQSPVEPTESNNDTIANNEDANNIAEEQVTEQNKAIEKEKKDFSIALNKRKKSSENFEEPIEPIKQEIQNLQKIASVSLEEDPLEKARRHKEEEEKKLAKAIEELERFRRANN